MSRLRMLLWPASLLALAIAVGFDGYRPPVSARILQLELELEAAIDGREAAIERAEELAVEVAELEASLEVEQAHREQAERKLVECEKRAAR